MSPAEKQLSEEERKKVSQTLQAPVHADLVKELQSRGMTMQQLRGNAELGNMVRDNPPDLQEKVHNFLAKLVQESEKGEIAHEPTPSTKIKVKPASGHETTPSTVVKGGPQKTASTRITGTPASGHEGTSSTKLKKKKGER